MPVLEAAATAAQLGWIGQKEFQKVFRRTWAKAFPDFDLEKVFWQAVYAEGIFVVASLVWRVGGVWRAFMSLFQPPEYHYETTEVSGEVPQEILDEAWEHCETIWGLAGSPAAIKPCIEERLAQQGYEAVDVKKVSGTGDQPGVDVLMDIMDDVFVGQYFPFVLMGIPVLFLLLEYKNYRRRKKAKKFFGGS